MAMHMFDGANFRRPIPPPPPQPLLEHLSVRCSHCVWPLVAAATVGVVSHPTSRDISQPHGVKTWAIEPIVGGGQDHCEPAAAATTTTNITELLLLAIHASDYECVDGLSLEKGRERARRKK